ncbi:MAG TPA: cysteine--tRNA ligase [Candidatus Paceibacterota bacterium]|nr:cysteine--tRNA ligase [Candidatus Paceibacterota bacterium]
MSFSIYNTLTRKKEILKPIKDGFVGIYTCGPTVYNHLHIGNWRAYVFSDLLRRSLEYDGYRVSQIMNITDIDDKTIRNSQKEGKSLRDFTSYYTEQFFKDRDLLNIKPATEYTKASEYIKPILILVKKLIDKGFAYKAPDGSIYFDISRYPLYGKLSKIKAKGLKENADNRMKTDEYTKDDINDFALWKAWTEQDGPNFWIPEDILGEETDISKGRPGWHIECSAMSMDKLGNNFDIHTGGVDLIFPHHENEIAQSVCATAENFANYFMHNEHLLVDGKKMSKSVGNFYTLSDLINKGIKPAAFRFWLYTSNYMTKINFTEEAVLASQTALEKLENYFEDLGQDLGEINLTYQNKFKKYLADNLNSPKVIALIWQLIKDKNVSSKDKKATLLDFDKVLGFNLGQTKTETPKEIIGLAEERQQARINKDWAKSDVLRQKIKELGYEIKDMDDGYKIKKIG